MSEGRSSLTQWHGLRCYLHNGHKQQSCRVQTHHQLACAPFCHATSSNSTSKKAVPMVCIFDCYSIGLSPMDTLSLDRSMVGFDGKKKKNREKPSIRRFSHAFLTLRQYQSSNRIERSIPRLTDREIEPSSVIRPRSLFHDRKSSRTRLAFSFSLSFPLFSTGVSFYMFLRSYGSLISRQTTKRYATLSVPTRTAVFFCLSHDTTYEGEFREFRISSNFKADETFDGR